VPRIEAYVARFLSKKAYNPAAIEGQQQMKKGSTGAAKRACTKASVQTVTAEQLDRELAAARPPSPPPDPAASAAWHQDNGLAAPDHLTTEPGLTTQGAGPSTETAPAELAGTSQPCCNLCPRYKYPIHSASEYTRYSSTMYPAAVRARGLIPVIRGCERSASTARSV
jgi:hypothetical protein